MAASKTLLITVLGCFFGIYRALLCWVGTETIAAGYCPPPCGAEHTSALEPVECPTDLVDPMRSMSRRDERCVDGDYTAVRSCVSAASCTAANASGRCMTDGEKACCSTDNCNSEGAVQKEKPSLVKNPSGNCSNNENGGRLSYHSISYGYLLARLRCSTCARTLEGLCHGSANVIPRPDALVLRYLLCDGDASLPQLVRQHGMCTAVADPDVINRMSVADALQITHALHQRLVFESRNDGGQWSVDPFAPDEDILAACYLLSVGQATQENAASNYCNSVQNRCNIHGMCAEITGRH